MKWNYDRIFGFSCFGSSVDFGFQLINFRREKLVNIFDFFKIAEIYKIFGGFKLLINSIIGFFGAKFWSEVKLW